MTDKLPLTSTDTTADRLAALRDVVPEAFTDAGIDLDRLRSVLGDDVDDGPERYELTWAGKRDAQRTLRALSAGTLVPDRDQSVDFDVSENVFVEGDNLEVLRLLQKAYHGRVKMIYIDPPYNTGNDFIYPDDFKAGLDEYLRFSGQTDEEGNARSSSSETAGRYHSDWLSMMYPRLALARNLLRPDGLICVSIDDNESRNLRLLMDEVFGTGNFICTIMWQKRYVSNVTASHVSDMHDFIHVYARDAKSLSVNDWPRSESQKAAYKNPDNDERGDWRAQDLSASKPYRAGMFTIVGPTGESFNPPPNRYWRCNEEQFEKWKDDGRIWWGVNGDARPMLKSFLNESTRGITPHTWWDYDFAGHNKQATLEVKGLFDGAAPFDTPKPVRLIRRLIETFSDDSGLVVDFFAGSSTTAHAVLAANREDGGNRRFIMVQLPEPSPEGSTARELGFETLSSVSRERVRRAADQIHGGAPKEDGTNEPENPGFRAFRLTSSNFDLWDADDAPRDADALGRQLEMYADHLKPDRSPEDVLFEILLKSGFPLSAPVDTVELPGGSAYSVADGALLVCLTAPLTPELVDALAASDAAQVVVLDHALTGDDRLKTNARLTFEAQGVEFRTV